MLQYTHPALYFSATPVVKIYRKGVIRMRRILITLASVFSALALMAGVFGTSPVMATTVDAQVDEILFGCQEATVKITGSAAYQANWEVQYSTSMETVSYFRFEASLYQDEVPMAGGDGLFPYLQPGDSLNVKVFAWRSFTADLPELIGEYDFIVCPPVTGQILYSCQTDTISWQLNDVTPPLNYTLEVYSEQSDSVEIGQYAANTSSASGSVQMSQAVAAGVVREDYNEASLYTWEGKLIPSVVFRSVGCDIEPTPTPTPTPTVEPTPTPTVEPTPPPLGEQILKAPKKVLKKGKSAKLAKATRQGAKVKWKVKGKTCKVKVSKLFAGKKKGTCRLTATAPAVPKYKAYTGKFTVKVK